MHPYRTLTPGCSLIRLRLPLVVGEHRRFDGLLVDVHVALPGTVVRPAVVDDVRHVMGHVFAPRSLLLGNVLALFHAQDLRQALDRDL